MRADHLACISRARACPVHQGVAAPQRRRCRGRGVRWKLQPELLAGSERFSEVPSRQRRALARVLGARQDGVVLVNSASYGLHLVANGLELGPEDEAAVPANDFPSDILPWLSGPGGRGPHDRAGRRGAHAG